MTRKDYLIKALEECDLDYDVDSKDNWWSLSLKVNGKAVWFDELSEATQEHILKCISDGYVCGEICEYTDNECA